MQLMLRLGMVTSERSLFDYGCGQGEDVAALASQGYQAFGWDPHHAADGRRQAADVVNLGFVLNVIEDPRERTETLKAAWGFARDALCVSVMVQGRVDTRGAEAASRWLSNVSRHVSEILRAAGASRIGKRGDRAAAAQLGARDPRGVQRQGPRTGGLAAAALACFC